MSAASPENPHAGEGMVLLDIGGDVGALVVDMPRSMLGEEVEIRPGRGLVPDPEEEGHVPHVAVVDRPVPGGGQMPSLVFPDLVAGPYALFVKGSCDVVLRAEVNGGAVTTAVWPG